MTTIAPPPKGLSKKAIEWWRDLMQHFVLDDPGAKLMLEAALRAFDRSEAARAVIDRDGTTVRDRFGQVCKHPAISIERDSRAQMIQALKALGLDPDTAEKSRIGRKPGSSRGMP